ncbi:MAG: peptidoglycan-binding domain-containing protein [Saprospiraceae bacterium]
MSVFVRLFLGVCCFLILDSFRLEGQIDSFYTVLVGEYMKPQPKDFQSLRNLGFLFLKDGSDNKKKVCLGVYSHPQEAEIILDKIKKKGYPLAVTQPIDLNAKKTFHTIQLGVFPIGTSVNWKDYFQSGYQVYAVQENDILRICIGNFKNEERQQKALKEIKETDFPEALPKSFPEGLITEVTEFSSGLNFAEFLMEQTQPDTNSSPFPISMEVLGNLSTVSTTDLKYPPIQNSSSSPEIRELQSILVYKSYLSGEIDGIYDSETSAAIQTYFENDLQWDKYLTIGRKWFSSKEFKSASLTQKAINVLDENPAEALDILNNSQHPMAIAYRNFHLFIKNGPDKKYTEALHFAVDTSICYQEQYDSLFKNDLDSLNFIRKGEVVKVLAFLHQQFPDFEVPCWLMEKHPIEFQEAFAPDSFFKNYPYKTANCEGFSEWPEFIVLKAMIRDLQMQKDLHSSTLTLLYQTGKEVGDSLSTDFENWQLCYFEELESWQGEEAYTCSIGDTFKIAFLQSFGRMRAYFIGKGAGEADAKILALAALNSICGDHFNPFSANP